jgi:hypothetical protein
MSEGIHPKICGLVIHIISHECLLGRKYTVFNDSIKMVATRDALLTIILNCN